MRPTLVFAFVMVLASGAMADPIQWRVEEGGNGHYYEHVVVSLNWTDAMSAAAERTWDGATGHLATLTSAEENVWVWTSLGEPFQAWLGGFQLDPSAPADVGWTWVTGEPWEFTNWWPGEPNDAGWFAQEDVLHFTQTGAWNDLNGTHDVEAGMIVEYESGTVSSEESSWGSIKALFVR